MPYLDDWDDKKTPAPAAYEATISNDVSSSVDDLFVRLPTVDAGRSRWGPCRWAPRVTDGGSAQFPDEGDKALVVKSDDGEYWILQWWPYS
jgi:hypothetical protein